MTQATSKKLRSVFTTALLASMLAPSFALAETPKERLQAARENSVQGTGGKNFCTNIDTAIAKINEARSKMQDKKTENRADKSAKLTERRGLKDGKLDDKRGEHDVNRMAAYDNMYAKATTTEQKAAVDAFKASVEASVTKRKTAVDGAIATFRTSADKLINDRTAAVDTAAATHKSTMDTAIAKAKADCASGIDPATVRSTLQSSIKAANEAFRSSAKRPEDLDDQVKALRDARDTAIKAAMDTFKSEYEAAKTALKTALKK